MRCIYPIGINTCSCNPGYTLSEDDASCTDNDECAAASDNNCAPADNNGICTNTDGGFVCSCAEGYTLGPNNVCDGNVNTSNGFL